MLLDMEDYEVSGVTHLGPAEGLIMGAATILKVLSVVVIGVSGVSDR